MNQDLLNKASDLRRIANWIGRGQTEKLDLIERLLESINNDPRVYQILKHFQADTDPKDIMGDERKRIFLAEQLLISSSRVMSLA